MNQKRRITTASIQAAFSNSAVILCLLLALIGHHSVLASEKYQEYDPVTMDLPTVDVSFPPAFHEVFIPINDYRLTGFMLTANGQGPHPTVVLLHGLPGNEKNLDLAQSLRRAGFNVLFFHYSGAWGSEGKYSFLQLDKDALAAIQFIRDNAKQYRVDTEQLTIMGHSFGGYTALKAATQDKHLACVVAISAANPAVIGQSERVDKNIQPNIGNYIDNLFMLKEFSGEQAIAELKNNTKTMDPRTFGKALMGKQVYLIVGNQDQVTPPALQQQLNDSFQQVRGLKFKAVYIDGDHAFSTTRIELQRRIVIWMLGHCQ